MTPLSRRRFLSGAAAAAALHPLASGGRNVTAPAKPKIKIGLIGAGGRGRWIAGLFQEHGGYQFHAVADYFQPVADRAGQALGVDKSRCFSGLSGFQKLIDSGIDAVVIETPPYFMPEQAAAAVAAGLHVYMAKPVAVDVPGCMIIDTSAAEATRKKKVFLVDYQMPTDPINIQVAERIRSKEFGPLLQIQSIGICGGFSDPPPGDTIEGRLQNLVWVNDVALGCDYIGNFDIHAIDAALWVIGERPVSAVGSSRIGRVNPHGDARDVCSVVYRYDNGVVHNHYGQGLENQAPGTLRVIAHGANGHGQIDYMKEAYMHGRGNLRFKGGAVENLYKSGAVRNIATFHQQVIDGVFTNDTVRRSVDGCLTSILGREAAARGIEMTMEQLLSENKKLQPDLTGLKA